MVEPKKGTKWPSNLPRFESRQQAIAVCKDLCKFQFMHRSEKRGKGDLVVSARDNQHAIPVYSKTQPKETFLTPPLGFKSS